MIPSWLLFALPFAAVIIRMGLMVKFILLPDERAMHVREIGRAATTQSEEA